MRGEHGEAAAWGLTEHLLAVLVETVDATSWRSVMPHAKKGWKPPQPFRIERPGAPRKPKKRNATSADLARIFGASGRYVPGGDN